MSCILYPVCAVLLLALSPAASAQTCAVDVQDGKLVLTVEEQGAKTALIRNIGYAAKTNEGLAFETAGATLEEDGRLSFALSGPDAASASVSAKLARLPRGFSLDWVIKYSGPERQWNPWTSGFRLDFAREITGARTQPVTKWVKPTGAHPWEVAGDAPYPDTECQLRTVLFGETALVMVSSAYDPDWIHKNNLQRARFARFGLPKETPCERATKITFLVVPADDLDPARLAAEAARYPVALSITTDRLGNLFEPGEAVQFNCAVSNTTEREQACALSLEAWSYHGERLLADTRAIKLGALAQERVAEGLGPQRRGIVFIAARLSWEGGETIQRAAIGILPERKASETLPDSPFAMAAIIANPETYPDHFDMLTVLRKMERIGVRWIRGGWFPLKAETTEDDERRVRERVGLLKQHGVLPYVQLGSRVPKPEELEVFKEKLAASLERFKWVSPYVEIGNELNHSGVKAADYVEKMLRPIHEVTRRVFPEGKIMSMGLGGVGKGWLDEFVKAGGMELIDVLSVHPGAHPRAPEFWQGWRGWVFRSQMLDAMKAGREAGGKEVWSTETYAPTPPGRSGLDLRTSADYMVRQYVCSLALGVKMIAWYQFQDGVWFAQRQRPDDVEYNFGVVYTDLTPKPAYVAFGAMTEQLEGANCLGRLDLGAEDLYGVRFKRDGQAVDVLWSYREKHETDIAWWPPEKFKDDSRKPGEPWEERWQAPVTVVLPAAGTVVVTDVMGNAREAQTDGGRVRLELNGSPVYVRGLGDMPQLPRLWEDIP